MSNSMYKKFVECIKHSVGHVKERLCRSGILFSGNNRMDLFHDRMQGGRWPYYSDDEIDAVVEVLKSGRVNYWTGDTCKLFEQEFASKFGTKHAIALANGTVAIELALRAVGILPGDEVIVPSRTFVATASAVVAIGGRPVFADIDPITQNTTAVAIAEKITSRTRAVIVVHVGGNPCDMESICNLVKRHSLKLIEDCAQAHGAAYQGKPVGSIGDVGAFSFCQDKILSTGGEGGMLITNDDGVYEAAWSYKDHGKSRESMAKPSNGCFRFIHDYAGTNFRMTSMQAAIGRVQLKKLDSWVEARQIRANRIIRKLKDLPNVEIAYASTGSKHAYYRLYATLSLASAKQENVRDCIVSDLCKAGFTCVGSGSCGEIYKELAMKDFLPDKLCVNAESTSQSSLAFNVHQNMNLLEIDRMVSALISLCSNTKYWHEYHFDKNDTQKVA